MFIAIIVVLIVQIVYMMLLEFIVFIVFMMFILLVVLIVHIALFVVIALNMFSVSLGYFSHQCDRILIVLMLIVFCLWSNIHRISCSCLISY
jgi:hypothetical protein